MGSAEFACGYCVSRKINVDRSSDIAIRMAPCFQSCFSWGCIKPNEKQAVDVKRLTKARSII